MYAKPKTIYHPCLLTAFYLKCLLPEWIARIPPSTRHDWRQKMQSDLCGCDRYNQHEALLSTLQQVAPHRRLQQVNRALLRVIALHNFIRGYDQRIKDHVGGINAVVLCNLYKIIPVLGSQATLRYLGRSYGWLLQLRRRVCSVSALRLCRARHPFQLLAWELSRISQYCADDRYRHWSLASLYHQMRREGMAGFAIQTFYKYAALLQIERSHPHKRRKHHDVGIRASAPLRILHADTTIFRTADNRKRYIYLVQDNFFAGDPLLSDGR